MLRILADDTDLAFESVYFCVKCGELPSSVIGQVTKVRLVGEEDSFQRHQVFSASLNRGRWWRLVEV